MKKEKTNKTEEVPVWRVENEDGSDGVILDNESQSLMEEIFKTWENEDGETMEEVMNKEIKKNKTK